MKPQAPAPQLSRSELAELRAQTRKDGRSIVLANGAFDLLHVGHLRYLRAAAEQGDYLLVAVNSDASVRSSKGPERPVIPEQERLELLAALPFIDALHLFDEVDVRPIISALQPDLQAKGTDYREDTVPEADFLRRHGGRVVIVGDPKDHSTSALVKNLNSHK